MLWQRILAEAEQPAGSENVLAPLIADCITSRTNLADSICSRIAELLAPPRASASLLSALRSLVVEDAGILSAAGQDIAAVLERDPATTKALHVLLHAKGFLAIQAYRFSNTLWKADRRELALHLQGCVSRALQVDIHPATQVGAGVFFDHATGIVIGETTVIENNVSILQNVTLGGTGKEQGQRHPKVRHGVLIGAGATILGNIEVGANARIGAGSVVVKPVAPGTTVAGVPARVHRELINVAVRHSEGRLPIIAGTGANSTSEAIELTQSARKARAVAALSVVPYYNKPTQTGLVAHFKAIAEAVDIPLILYNVPGRTITDLADETILRLSEAPNIAGLKDATGDIGRGASLMCSLPQDFAFYSGDYPTAAALMLLGARGTISVTANVIPATMARLCAAARAGEITAVREISRRIAPLHKALFVESNPIPVKWALERLGKLSAFYRLPLTPLSPTKHAEVEAALHLAMDATSPLIQ
jgi:4-hydroxy-tetrahydrodipicolinate synthase